MLRLPRSRFVLDDWRVLGVPGRRGIDISGEEMYKIQQCIMTWILFASLFVYELFFISLCWGASQARYLGRLAQLSESRQPAKSAIGTSPDSARCLQSFSSQPHYLSDLVPRSPMTIHKGAGGRRLVLVPLASSDGFYQL